MVAISLLLVGFAHQPVLNAAQLAQETYLTSMGLTVDDLCGTPDEDGQITNTDCPVCHIASAMLMPVPVKTAAMMELRIAATVLIPAATRALGRSQSPKAPARAPPLA